MSKDKGDTMKLIAKRDVLADLAAACSAAIKPNHHLPKFQCLLLKAESDRLTLFGTDLEVSVRAESAQVQLEATGTAAVNADKFVRTVQTAPGETVALELAKDQLCIRCEDGVVKLPTGEAKDFPLFDAKDPERLAVVPQRDLLAMLKCADFAAGDDARFAMKGVYLHLNGDNKLSVGADGRRMAVKRIYGGVGKVDHVVAERGVGVLLKLLENDEGTAEIMLSGGRLLFRFGDFEVGSPMPEGARTPYDSVIVKDPEQSVRIGRDCLIGAVRRASVVIDDSDTSLRFAFTPKQGLTISGRGGGESSFVIPCKVKTEMTIGLHPRRLLDGLSMIEGDDVTIDMNSPARPVMFSAKSDFQYVMQPINLEGLR